MSDGGGGGDGGEEEEKEERVSWQTPNCESYFFVAATKRACTIW